MYAGRIWKCKQHQISEHRNAWCEEPHNNRPKLLRPKRAMQSPGKPKKKNTPTIITSFSLLIIDHQFNHINIELCVTELGCWSEKRGVWEHSGDECDGDSSEVWLQQDSSMQGNSDAECEFGRGRRWSCKSCMQQCEVQQSWNCLTTMPTSLG